MPDLTKHQRALELLTDNRTEEASALLSSALGELESGELWNDWATVKIALNQNDEARTGYERALELKPGNTQAQFNLGLLLIGQGRIPSGLALLKECAPRLGEAEQAAFSSLREQHKDITAIQSDSALVLNKFADKDEVSRKYFATHRERYIACVDLLPKAQAGQKLLELGSFFHHLTPAFEDKGYSVRCADFWDGEATRETEIASVDGSDVRKYVVDNFDIQHKAWPYQDGEFDVVIFCEILEHLSDDPMLVMAEINRILKKDGLLLLTTPNIASAKSVHFLLDGNSPYVWGAYNPGGSPTDRHNREFTAGEVERFLHSAGFDLITLETRNSWWKGLNGVLAKLVASGHPIAHRGDNILALARKADTIRDRYPEEFYCRRGSEEPSPPEDQGDGKRILIIHEVLPHFDRCGSDMRILQVVRRLRAQGHRVTFIGRYPWNRESYQPTLDKLGVTSYCGDAERLSALGFDIEPTWKFTDVLEKGNFDAAILFHWFWNGLSVTEQYLDDIRHHSPQTKVLVLTDDRHGVREWRRAELSGHSADRERALDYLAREVECYSAADLVLAITEDDHQGLLEMVPELQVELLPMTAETRQNDTGFEDRCNFIFLADFNNPASRDAAQWLCKEIWPRIRKRLPRAKLLLAGNGNTTDFAREPQVEILGYVASIEDTLKSCRVFVSPIQYGTGIKTKNLNALGNGIPLVTTTIGAEGMNLTDQENALIADSAGAFANKAVEAYNNRDLWEKLAANGPKHMEAGFSVSHLDAQITKIIDRLAELTPRLHDPEHHFSIRVVEQLHPHVLDAKPAEMRYELRMRGYMELAEQLLSLGRPAEALEQARHVFSYLGGTISHSLFVARVLSLLERCYRETGDTESAAKCGEEAKLCIPELNSALVQAVTKKGGSRVKPSDCAASVIVPTFNRREKLARCLLALAAQTLPADEFEVIVVDDGSTDDTQEFLRSQKMPFRLKCLQQKNQGAGSARKLGVEHARGEYLVLINDDTIAAPDLLKQHLLVQRRYHDSCFAILGAFDYERAARRRALTYFLSTDSFMFPQKTMIPEHYYGHTHFVTCNLSVRRDAVLACGSFDPAFRLGEDTELGLRMAQGGCKVLYHPEARAIHDHLEMTIDDMVRRAKAYGPVYLHLLEKHPSLLIPHPTVELRGPVTAADIEKLREALAPQRAQIEQTVQALKQYDDRDFEPFFATRNGQTSAAEVVLGLFHQAIPQVHWFYVFDALCSAWTEKAIVLAEQPAGIETRA